MVDSNYTSPIGSGFKNDFSSLFSSANPSLASGLTSGMSIATPGNVSRAGIVSPGQTGIQSGNVLSPAQTNALTSPPQVKSMTTSSTGDGGSTNSIEYHAPTIPQFSQDGGTSATDPTAGTRPFTGYSVTTPNTTNSDVLGSGLSYADVLNARSQLMNDYQDAAGKYANDYQNITGQQIKSQFAGDTTDYGTGMANLVKLESTPILTADQMRATNALNALGANNQTLGAIQPQQVSPGSSLVSPLGGNPIYTGMGASPSEVASQAQNLYQRDLTTGQPQMNTDGSINWNYYGNQARQLIAGASGQGGGDVGGSSPGQSAGPSSGAYGSQGYGNVSSIPSELQPYVLSAKVGDQGLNFIQSDRVPATLQPMAQAMAAKAGIPYLDSDGAKAVYAAQQILDVVDSANALAIRNLKPGVGGHITDSMTNWANNFLQFNPDLSNFAQLKDAASKATTALAGGQGSGFRMSMPVIENAINNMSTANDNLENALTKNAALANQIRNAIAPVFPQMGGGTIFSNQYSSSNPTGAGSSSSGNPFDEGNF